MPPHPQTPRSITIKTFPFNPPIASHLTNALDDELNEMYPDWNDLPHPGFQEGFVGGDSLTTSDGKECHTEQDQQQPEICFFVAFDITDSDDQDPTSLLTAPPAIACIALKPLPYFPYHRPQSPSNLNPTLIPQPPSPSRSSGKYAELKRLYIAPSHRSVPVTSTSIPSPTTSSSLSPPTRLSTLLIQTATQHAQSLGITRLVLETGIRQHAAIRVYERLGWTRRPEYGDYVGAGVEEGGVSVCFEIVIADRIEE